jgi:hypothetical protein
MVDAPSGFDPGSCPTSYTVTTLVTASRYRIVRNDATFWDSDTRCSNDAPGLTHLAVFETEAEAAALGALVGSSTPPTNAWYFVGAVQAPNQTTPSSGWSWLTGDPMNLSWSAGDPDDGTGIEQNRENLAVVDPMGELHDVFEASDSGHVDAGSICECDGKATSSAVRNEIPHDPT